MDGYKSFKSSETFVRLRRITAYACMIASGFNLSVAAHAGSPMTFTSETDSQKRWAQKVVGGGVEDIYAEGDITEGTTDRLLAFIQRNQIQAAKIHFNSPGGSLIEGMNLGRAIRSLQFFTTVGVYQIKYDPGADTKSICASACAYAFAGGTSRFLSKYTGKLGIHQFYSESATGTPGEIVQQISGLIVAYLAEMGVDAKAFTISTIADRNGMIWLTPEEALSLRFANNGSSPPIAEIKLLGMTPYLRVQQDHSDVTTRVLFNCANRQIYMQFGIVTDQESSRMFASNQKRSYLELDNKDFLVAPGRTGAIANGSVVWIARSMTPAALLQFIHATNVGGWIDGFGSVRYGATLEMPTVRAKIAEFAKQCYGL